jgi:hypothetical protein
VKLPLGSTHPFHSISMEALGSFPSKLIQVHVSFSFLCGNQNWPMTGNCCLYSYPILSSMVPWSPLQISIIENHEYNVYIYNYIYILISSYILFFPYLGMVITCYYPSSWATKTQPKSVASVRRPLSLALRWSVSCGLVNLCSKYSMNMVEIVEMG